MDRLVKCVTLPLLQEGRGSWVCARTSLHSDRGLLIPLACSKVFQETFVVFLFLEDVVADAVLEHYCERVTFLHVLLHLFALVFMLCDG